MKCVIAICLACILAVGCQHTDWEKAPELRPALVAADEYIGVHFGKRFCDIAAIDIYWEDSTFAMEGNDIFINRSARGKSDLIDAYMRHELFHLTTGLRDREAVYYNGVRIADWIGYGMSK